MNHPVVSLLIPVYNEEQTIEAVLEHAARLPYDAEIIVIDDCSTDRTPELLRAHDVIVVRLRRNSGRGAALRAGIVRATGQIIAFMDGDMEVSPDAYRTLIDPILEGGAQVVVGSRFLSGSAMKMSLLQRNGNRALTALARLLYRTRQTDVESGTVAFRANVLRTLQLRSNGWDLSIETAARLGRRGIPVIEVPIDYQPRSVGAGKKLHWRDFFAAVYYVVKYAVVRDT